MRIQCLIIGDIYSSNRITLKHEIKILISLTSTIASDHDDNRKYLTAIARGDKAMYERHSQEIQTVSNENKMQI